MIAMPNGILALGGNLSPSNSDFLPDGSNTWKSGPKMPRKGFSSGCAVKTSSNELVLIGGYTSRNKVFKYNRKARRFIQVGSLQQERWGHACYTLKEGIIVSGGSRDGHGRNLDSTEIVDLESWTSRKVGNLKEPRAFHGMALVEFNSKQVLIAYGGYVNQNRSRGSFLTSIEIWTDNQNSWEMSTIELEESRRNFSTLTVPSTIKCP